MSSDPVLILVGTQTGNSEVVAEEIAAELEAAGEEVDVLDMADAYPEMLEEVPRLVVVLCTWAEGTFPDNAVAFWESLREIDPNCSGLAYGIVALGDRLYDPYYQVAAYALDARLQQLGGQAVLDMLEIDGPVRPTVRRLAREWAGRFRRASARARAS